MADLDITPGWATGSMGRVEAGKEADPGLNNVDDRNTPIELRNKLSIRHCWSKKFVMRDYK